MGEIIFRNVPCLVNYYLNKPVKPKRENRVGEIYMPITIQELDEALARLEKRNRLPIYIYTILSALAFAVGLFLLGAAAYERDYKLAATMLAPTGIIGICGERMLRIWKDSIDIIRLLIEKTMKQ